MKMQKQVLLQLHKKLGLRAPDENDACAWMLLQRAFQEMQQAQRADVFWTKAKALVILCQFGWRDVFKESLNSQGTFISKEEAARFEFCLDK